jgi:TP53 regulating kinase-like protein
VLDQRLTRHRILAEARILAKCRRDGLRVPAVYAIDEVAGWLMLEWIGGEPVRKSINARLGDRKAEDVERDEELRSLMRRMGAAVGKMHQVGVVHGDLTTSNMMLSPWPEDKSNGHTDPDTDTDTHDGGNDTTDASLDGEVVIIDLGLSSGSVSEEDRAVDLYVLERAFGSTHPRAEALFDEVLDAYRQSFKQGATVLKRLQDVRMRGRKRSMLG